MHARTTLTFYTPQYTKLCLELGELQQPDTILEDHSQLLLQGSQKHSSGTKSHEPPFCKPPLTDPLHRHTFS